MSNLLDVLGSVFKGDPITQDTGVAPIASNASPPGIIQPLTVLIQGNTPMQLPVRNAAGITIVNNLSVPLTIGTEPTFTVNPSTVSPGAALPWPTHTTVWCQATATGNVTVFQGLTGISQPNVTTTPSGSTSVFNQTVTSNSVNQVSLPSGTQAILVVGKDISVPATVPDLAVGGADSSFPYILNGAIAVPPYLESGLSPKTYYWITPVDSAADPIVNVSISGGLGDNMELEVFASPNILHESDFYNEASGILIAQQTLLTTGSVTVLTGPARIVYLELLALAGGTNSPNASLGFINTIPGVLRADASPPDGVILRAGQVITLSSNNGAGNPVVGTIGYVYP